MGTPGLVDVLDMLDAAKVSGVLAVVGRLARLRMAIVAISGRVISGEDAGPIDSAEEERLRSIMVRHCREHEAVAEGARTGAGADACVAEFVTVRGLQVGVIVAIGEEPYAGASSSSIRVVRTYLENVIKFEYELECLSGEIAERYEEVNLLYELSEALAAVYDVPTICRVAIEKGLSITAAKTAVVLLERAPGDAADETAGDGPASCERAHTVVAAEGPDASRILGGRVDGHAFIEAVHASGAGLLVIGLSDFPDISVHRNGESAPLFFDLPVLAVSLRVGDTARGIIAVSGTEYGEPFRAGDMKNLGSIAMQTSIALQNCQLLEDARQAERVKRDMELAEAIQSRLLPSCAPDARGIEIAGHALHPAHVGGDYYDYIATRPDLVDFVIADVTGHSFGSALGMAMARTVLRGVIADGRAPHETLAAAARALYSDLSASDLMLTVFVARWVAAERAFDYASAGHNPALLWRARERKAEWLDADGMIIGIMENAPYVLKSVSVEPGDVLVLYTDGVIEAKNPRGAMFGETRFQEMLGRCAAMPAAEIMATLFEAVRAFIADAEVHDDISIVVVKVVE